jgi:glycosyltransferase involved in cell wall biosynthesis
MMDKGMTKKVRLAYLVSHPIQYQAPLLRRIAQEPDIELTVFFGSDFSVRGYKDPGFGVDVKWDVPLVEGYRHEFLPVLRDGTKMSFSCPLNYGIFSRLRGRKGEAPFDILWSHGYATANALHAILAAKSLGIPVLVRTDTWLGNIHRGTLKLFLKRMFFQFLKNMIDGVLSAGTLNAAYWRYYLGNDFPIFLMPYAVDNEYFQQKTLEARDRRAELLQELNLDADRPVILFASKLRRQKNGHDLLDAYKNLISGWNNGPHPYLLIVGDGEERAALEEQARVHGLEGIRFCGFRNQSELPRFFDICTVFVLPARYEAWGLVVNEAMNAAKPVIISDNLGCQPDLVTNGVEGYAFPVGDVSALTEALRQILATPEAANMAGQRALEKIQTWSFEENVHSLRHAIAQLTHKITA